MRKLFPLIILSNLLFLNADSQDIKAVSVNLFTYLPENNNERSLRDGIAIIFNGQSDSVDLSDAKKLSNPLENIAILRNNILLAAEQRNTYDTIPITLWNLQQRDYELELFTKNINKVYLEDVNTHDKIYLATAADTLRYRFTSQSENTVQDSAVGFWLIFDTVTIVAPPPPPPTPSCGNGPRNPRRRDHGACKLYPNPVYGSYINLEMTNLSAGMCKVTILGGNYGTAYSFVHGDKCTERINTSQLPKGKYYFIIEDEEGWKETRQVEIN